ncbi:MAG TPA: DNA polymerase III subunit gamma and tau [Streptosporangiaceae bacterium]|jgi:DNA polymerase-3 subunit gamma/tau
MSLALYRKYRPATFAELKGQEHVAEPLQQALRNGRIHHAYLFSGPRGCGKTSSARILARSLNCEQGPTPEPCGVCESCVALAPTGPGHIDVIEIDAASHGGVDDARDLRERAFFAPVAARFKIYIIDEAHMVTREGFNALLKLVEEPPPHLKFVFATTEPEKVIGTIRSRTHHYPFRLMPPGTLRELLEEILTAEGVAYEASALPLVVRAGAGSARDSLSILDQLLAGADSSGVTYARAVSLLGYTDSSLLDDVVDAFAARDGAAVFAAVDRVIESGQDPRRFAADLLERFRDLVVLSNVPDAGAAGLFNVPPDELERMRRQASVIGPAELARAADLLHVGLTEMRGATSPRLLLELICARILLPGAYDDEASLLTRMERLERRLSLGGDLPAAEPTARPPEPAASARAPESPPARGADPTSSVKRQDAAPKVERRSVDNPPKLEEKAGESKGAGKPTEVERPQAREASAAEPAPAPAAAGGLDVSAVRRAWPDVLETVKRKSRVAWMVLMEGVQVASLDGDVLTLAFENEGKRKGFVGGGRDVVVREALKEYLAVDWRIETVTGTAGNPAGGRPSGDQPDPSQPAQNPSQSGGNPGSGPVSGTAVPPTRGPVTPAADPVPPPPPPEPPSIDESDEVDPEGDANAEADDGEHSGMALIQRELGGKVIQEIDNSPS